MEKENNLDKLLNSILQKYPEITSPKGWKNFLDAKYSGWEEIIKNNKDDFEKFQRYLFEKANYSLFSSIYPVFLDALGFDSAVDWFSVKIFTGWFSVKNSLVKTLAGQWIYFHLSDILTDLKENSTIWQKLDDDLKEFIINSVFERYPGKPFSEAEGLSDEEVEKLIEEDYTPSDEINLLIQVVEDANDKVNKQKIENKIIEYKIMLGFKEFPYILNEYEKKLIYTLMEKFFQRGYKYRKLPTIVLSFKKSCLEEIFGYYIPEEEKIVLKFFKIKSFLERHFNLDYNFVKQIFLLNGISLWLIHRLPYNDGLMWKDSFFISSREEVRMGWAQLLTWWVVKDTPLKEVFVKLNEQQPCVYKIYKIFKNYSEEVVIDSLAKLRNLGASATLEKWEQLLS